MGGDSSLALRMTGKRSEGEMVKWLVAYLNGLCYKYSAIVITTDMWDRIDGSCGIKNSDTEVVGPD